MTKRILLAAPRGFCAGVDRAIEIVERALAKFGAPVYVRHEIVHNKYVVQELRDKGAVFVEELGGSPAKTRSGDRASARLRSSGMATITCRSSSGSAQIRPLPRFCL